ncbi:MAG: MBL fold metallo-hydrolase [Candidatus Dormibacteria bacterium]|jgi:glyoxylase-like metal-dependent hydrolase (beta-lactamase superfamily II)
MTPAGEVAAGILEDGDVRIVTVGPMGPYGNNAYIVRDTSARAGLLVDMPLEEGRLLAAIAAEGGVQTVIATHWHHDHWMTYDAVRRATGAPVLVGAEEVNVPEARIDGRLQDGRELLVGGVRVVVLHTPGHTPGSISLRVGWAVITGDTLFHGGPGKTFARGDLEVILASIDAKLLPLPDMTVVLPGHGGSTTVGRARSGREAYRRHPRAAGFHGDVEWGS